jgi:predicted ATPase
MSMSSGRVPAGRLLERATELDAIAAALQSACSGLGSALLVEGTAGIGKTRLLTHACLHGLYWLTAGIAQRAPLLLAVDDLHWADQPSPRFAVHLARRLEGLPVLLVRTVREPRSGTAQEKELTASLAAEASVTALRPAALGAAACAELVRGALGGEPSPAFQEACRKITGGNPLLLNALLTSLAAEGITGTDADVPHLRRLTPGTVSRSVLLQLGRMPAAALAAARAVAALTPSELRVAQLAAAGQANRPLFVTQRTVETHLTSSYRRLRISWRQTTFRVLDVFRCP